MLESIKNFFNTPLNTHAANVNSFFTGLGTSIKGRINQTKDIFDYVTKIQTFVQWLEDAKNKCEELLNKRFSELSFDEKIIVPFAFVLTLIIDFGSKIMSLFHEMKINEKANEFKDLLSGTVGTYFSNFSDHVHTKTQELSDKNDKSSIDHFNLFLLKIANDLIGSLGTNLSEENAQGAQPSGSLDGSGQARPVNVQDENRQTHEQDMSQNKGNDQGLKAS